MKKTLFFLNLLLIITLSASGILIEKAAAWSEPTASAPNDNVPAPINVSSNAQVKQGHLGLSGFDPGSDYGLVLQQADTAGIKVLNNTKERFATIMTDESAYSADVIGLNKLGLKVLTNQTENTGIYLSGKGNGAYINSTQVGAEIYGQKSGLITQSDETSVTANLFTDGAGHLAKTTISYFDGKQPVGLNTEIEGAAATLARNGIGLTASGQNLAGNFQGDVSVLGALTTKTLFVQQGCVGCGDLAENMFSHSDVQAGDIVAVDNEMNLIKADKNNKTVIGVISTNPSIGLSKKIKDKTRPLALSGLVSVKVVNENGYIEPGDFITASSKKGYGMKAVEPCSVVGKALEPLDKKKGTIKIFVNLSWFAGINQ
ncbi:MAG TPA: hypothetical protein VKP03_01220 [Patescibacteria group bacterium]|nr:hypothetical protein [Patescibacteria group bacterium]